MDVNLTKKKNTKSFASVSPGDIFIDNEETYLKMSRLITSANVREDPFPYNAVHLKTGQPFLFDINQEIIMPEVLQTLKLGY